MKALFPFLFALFFCASIFGQCVDPVPPGVSVTPGYKIEANHVSGSTLAFASIAVTSPEVLAGWQYAICFDETKLSFSHIENPEWMENWNGGAGPWFQSANSFVPGGVTVGTLIAGPPDFMTTPPGAYVAETLVFNVLPGVFLGDVVELRFSGIVQPNGPIVYPRVVIDGGYAHSPELSNGSVTIGSIFIRGDANQDGQMNVADPVFILANLFASAPPPNCEDQADVNDDGQINIADPVYSLLHLFTPGAPAPPEPWILCAGDPTPDTLGCMIGVCQ